jgi:hypothetical protein
MRAVLGFLLLSLALPAAAQLPERLVGAWETTERDTTGDYAVRLQLAGDGRFDLTLKGQVSAAELQGEGEPSLFPNGLTIAVTAAGTWRAQPDSFWVDLQQLEYRVNDLGLEAFLAQLIDQVIQSLVQSEGIPADQVPQFEQMLREQIGTQFSPEALEQELAGQMGADVLGAHGVAYTVDGDVLRTVDEDGQVTEWKKASVNSAVSAVSWGQLKASWR